MRFLTSRLRIVNIKTFRILDAWCCWIVQFCPIKNDANPVGHQVGEHRHEGGRSGVKVEDVPTEPVEVIDIAHCGAAPNDLDVIRLTSVSQVRVGVQTCGRVQPTDLEAVGVCGGVADGAVASLRPHACAV